ncbi:MAG: S41 family peptidase [Bacteroidaceae bacterium]|nr:S41 family peptidase [Bacteroidaceae bacterium]
MKKSILTAAFLSLSLGSQAENIRFAYHPCLSPDGKQIYFSYDGDIFRVPVTGGQATAIITMQGEQNSPIVSPDGKWLTFSSNIQGNNDVYVVPVAGGKATQLTFHEAPDTPVGWSADSKYIYFESTRTSSRKTTFRVAVKGGTPEIMFNGYFNTIVNLTENPKTGEFLFNESMESISFPTRKHYVGDHNPNIKSWNAKSKTYTELTTYIGKDQWPMVDKNGIIYYVSDESNGESQVVRYQKNGKPEVLTKFDKSVQYPSIAFDGSSIVFLKDYQITVLDPKSKKVSVPEIQIASGAVEVRRSFTGQRVQGGAVSPDGKKFALIIRGELYISDTKAKYLQKLETPANERVDEVVWAKDSKTIYYTRTNKGWTNIFKIAADLSAAEKAVFTSKNNVKNLTVNHKNDKAVFVDGSRDVLLLDLTNDKTEKLCSAEFWSFQGYDFSFSHDDAFIAFNAMNLFESDIYVYDLKAHQLHNLTNSAGVDNNAVFSPDGKYMYLTSNPTSSSFPKGARAYLYKLALQKYETPFKSDVFDKLFTEKKDEKADKNQKPEKDEKAEKVTPEIKIDYKDIYKRMTRMERGDNAQSNLFTYSSKGKDYLFYNSGYQDQYVLEISDPEAKPKKIKDGAYGTYSVSNDAIYLGTNNGILKLNPEAATATKIEIKKDVEKVLNDEFTQMFYETWAVMDQNYYDPKFHGANWPAVRDYYASFLPYVRTRENLRTLLTDLLGELNSSHLGFTSNGAEEKTETRIRSYATGIIFQNQAPFTIDYVLANSAADKIEIQLQKGDELVAVNGQKVNASMNREKLFSSSVAMDEAKCTFKRGGKEFSVKLHLQPYAEVKALEYKQWEEQRKEMVEQKTNGRVAYHHMQAMGGTDLNDFLLAMHTDAVHKDALILDLRYNNGGNVHKEVIDFLRGENYFTWAHRDFPKNSHPNVAPATKPIVVLVNEHSLSDAEVTSNGIKTLGIAKLVGTETYRWIIFTSSVRLLDGSTCRMPAWGCYNVKGEDLEHVGVKPDIYVKNTFKDRLENKDPQLDAAIQEILKQMK